MSYARDTAVLATPIGMVRIDGDHTHVHRLMIATDRPPPRRPDGPAVLAAVEQLEAWFAGALEAFDLALAPAKTPRGAELRAGLIAVGYGETLRYGDLARRLGSSPRAIGQLCARNPLPVIVPCHRVLATGGLGHYSAGEGPATKRWLLDFESRRRR